MKTVGIVVDDYKVDKFKKGLEEKELSFDAHKFSKDCTLIRCVVKDEEVVEILRLCKKLQIDIKRSN